MVGYPLHSTFPPLRGEAYSLWLAYGEKKAKMPWMMMIIQSIMGGFWAGLAGHICTNIGGGYYHSNPTTSKLIYAAIFPTGFVALVFTGAELYTGNTAAMSVYMFHHRNRKAFFALVRCWVVSALFNLCGAVLCAGLLSYSTNAFNPKSAPGPHAFLMSLAKHKTDLKFHEALCLGIGCNILVCFASWCAVIIQDGAGKILAIWFAVSGFCLGGFEHLVANFYTLSLSLMIMPPEYGAPFGFGRVAVKWIAVWIGNTIAGMTFTGFVWWYCFSTPQHSEKELSRVAGGMTEKVTHSPSGKKNSVIDVVS